MNLNPAAAYELWERHNLYALHTRTVPLNGKRRYFINMASYSGVLLPKRAIRDRTDAAFRKDLRDLFCPTGPEPALRRDGMIWGNGECAKMAKAVFVTEDGRWFCAPAYQFHPIRLAWGDLTYTLGALNDTPFVRCWHGDLAVGYVTCAGRLDPPGLEPESASRAELVARWEADEA